MVHQKLNTHYYDGKLGPKYQQLRASIAPEEILSLPTVINEIKDLIQNKLEPNRRTIALMILSRLATGPNQPKGENWDGANQIHVHDLLPLVWTRIKKYDESGQRLFLEQLVDIRGGMCPQGRTTRLLQVIEDQVDDSEAPSEKSESESSSNRQTG